MPLYLPPDRDLYRRSWITNIMAKSTHLILCQGCKGIITFNGDELKARRAARQDTSTPCQYCGWHPGWPPEPWLEVPPDGTLLVGN